MNYTGLKRLAAVLLMGALMLCSGLAAAQTAPSAGLGASWPNAQDVSKSPAFHVYVFSLSGVKYIQVNDANGNVRGGVAASVDGSTTLALPLGTAQVQVAAAPSDGAVVYQDSGTTVTASPTQGLVASPAGGIVRTADCTSVADCTKAPQ